MTDPQEPEIFGVLREIRYDLTAAQGKVTTALNMLAGMNLAAAPKITCPLCGVRLAGEMTLASHLANVHNGPPIPLSPEEEAA